MYKLREDQMVSLKKNYVHLARRKRYLLPLSCSPFQLSISFRHLLQTNYQYSLFHQTFEMLSAIKDWETANKNRSTINDRGMKLMITNGGATAAVVELFCKGEIQFHVEIPDQIITLNPKVSEIDESYVRIIERYKELLRSYKPGGEALSSTTVFKKFSTSKDSDIESDEEEEEGREEEEDKNDSDYTPCDDSSGCSSSSFARTASRIALYMMREELEDKMIDNSQHAHDFFVVNSCTVYCTVAESSYQNKTQQFEEKIEKMLPLKKEEIKSVIDELSSRICFEEDQRSEEDLRTIFINSGWTESEWPNMLKIINYLAEKKELGAKLTQLKVASRKYFKASTFCEITSFLVTNSIVIRTGVTEIRYIHRKYANLWLVSSRRLYRLTREKMKPISVNALQIAEYKRDILTSSERRRSMKRRKKQMTDVPKKRKLECGAVTGKQKRKHLAVPSLNTKERLSAFRRNRHKLSLKPKRQCLTEIKKNVLSYSSEISFTESTIKATDAAKEMQKDNCVVIRQCDSEKLLNSSDNSNQDVASVDKLTLNTVTDSIVDEKLIVLSDYSNVTSQSQKCDSQNTDHRNKQAEKEQLSTCSSFTSSSQRDQTSVPVTVTETEKADKSPVLINSEESVEHIDSPNTDKLRSIRSNTESKNRDSMFKNSDADLESHQENQNDMQVCVSDNNILSLDPKKTSTNDPCDSKDIESKQNFSQDMGNDPDSSDGDLKQENLRVRKRVIRKRGGITRPKRIEIDKATQAMNLEAAAKELENSQPIQIAMRPWVRINGTLSRRILDRFLGGVLGHCMVKPGNTLQSICERFSPAIQPFFVRELVEILSKIGCVKLYVLHRSCVATLFSPPSTIKLEPADGTESSARIIVEPQPDAISRLGQFIGNKAYKKDFLSC